MSIGQHLDDAMYLLRRAEDHLRVAGQADRYDLTAAISARDGVYRELGRLLSLIRARKPGALLTMQDATALLSEDGGGTVSPALILATGIRAATLGTTMVPADLLRARGSVAALLARSADAVGIAAEIVTTHLHPAAGAMNGNTNHRYLTREAAALMRGAQRPEAIAELARLALAAIRVDWQLVAHRWANPDALEPQLWDLLSDWVNGRYPAHLATMGNLEPAELLRQLDAVPAVERSPGPRHIGSWPEAIRAVMAARTDVRREPGVAATLAVARAAARLGFAAVAASWRLSGTAEPTPRAAAHADRWRELAAALSTVADLRDNMVAPLVAELELAKGWIREHGARGELTAADTEAVAQMQQQTGRLCHDLRYPLQLASIRGELVTKNEIALEPGSRGGILVAVPQWARPVRSDPHVAEMLHRLQTVAELPVIAPVQDTSVREPAPTRAVRELGDQVAVEAGLLAAARAWPQTARRVAQGRARHAEGQPAPARRAAQHDPLEREGWQR